MHCLIEFIFPRRLHRLAYFLRGVAFDAIAGFLYASSTLLQPGYWWPSVVLLGIYGLFFVILPRLRDVAMSAWWLLVALIPGANIVLGIILLFRAPVLLARPGPKKDASPNGDPAAPSTSPALTEGLPSVS